MLLKAFPATLTNTFQQGHLKMKRLYPLILLALSVSSASAQSIDDLAALKVSQDTLRAAQLDYDAKRKVVVDANAEAIRQVNLVVDVQTLVRLDADNTALRTELDALKTQAATDAARTAAVKAASATARDALAKAFSIAAIKAALGPLLVELAK